MLKRGNDGIVNQTTKQFEDISFSIRNNGNDKKQVRFFASNSNIPIESGSIFSATTASSPPTATGTTATIIANNKLYAGNNVTLEVYSLPDLNAVSSLALGSPFNTQSLVNVNSINEVWHFNGGVGGLNINAVDTVTDTVRATNLLGLFFTDGTFIVDDTVNNSVWVWQSGVATLIDKVTLSIVQTIPAPLGVTLSTCGTTWLKDGIRYCAIGFGNGIDDGVIVYNVATAQIISDIRCNGFVPQSLQYNPNDNCLYFGSDFSDAIGKVDIDKEEFSFINGWAITIAPDTFGNGFNEGIALDIKNNDLYVSFAPTGNLAKIPLSSFTFDSIVSLTVPAPSGRLYHDETNDQLFMYDGSTSTYGIVNTVNGEVSQYQLLGASFQTFNITEDPRRTYVYDASTNSIGSFETFNEVELLGSTASDGAEQAFNEVKFNPINCNKIRIDAQNNRKQGTNPIRYFTTTSTGKTESKFQPLIWELPATERFTIIELKEDQISEGGLKLDGQNGFTLDIEPQTEIFIEFAYQQQAFTDSAILIDPCKRSHLEDGSIKHPNVL